MVEAGQNLEERSKLTVIDKIKYYLDYVGSMPFYFRKVGFRGLVLAIKGKITKSQSILQIDRPAIKFPFFLRVPGSDIQTFTQVFFGQDYDFPVERTPKVIVDAGANIGLASIYFSNRFPDAKIIAIEPEESNLEIIRKNISQYGNITLVCGALWHKNSRINLVDPGRGKWGFMTQTQEDEGQGHGEVVHEVQGMTVDTIMKEHGINHIDILKIDIEGAELEVFRDSSSWIDKVDALIVELHDRMKPGCERSVLNGSKGFDIEWRQGENVYRARKMSCLIRGSGNSPLKERADIQKS